MAKVFLDIGGYRGESARAALDPRFGFDRVHCFEPVRANYESIVRTVRDPRLTVHHAGLLDRSATLPLYHAGSVGGSVYADGPATGGPVEHCRFIDASDFFREHLDAGDSVWAKFNCEGAECDIVLSLLASGQAQKLTEALLDLDARKIPSAQQKLAQVREAITLAPFSYHFPEEVQYGMVTNFGSIRNWLIVTGAIQAGLVPFLKSLAYQARCALDPSINGYYKIRLLRFLRLRDPAPVPTRAGSLRSAAKR